MLAWILVGGGVVTSLLTLYVIARVWTKAFWRARADAPEGDLSDVVPVGADRRSDDDIAFDDRDDVGRMPVGMLLPTGALIAVGLALTVFAGPIIAYQRAGGRRDARPEPVHRRRCSAVISHDERRAKTAGC